MDNHDGEIATGLKKTNKTNPIHTGKLAPESLSEALKVVGGIDETGKEEGGSYKPAKTTQVLGQELDEAIAELPLDEPSITIPPVYKIGQKLIIELPPNKSQFGIVQAVTQELMVVQVLTGTWSFDVETKIIRFDARENPEVKFYIMPDDYKDPIAMEIRQRAFDNVAKLSTDLAKTEKEYADMYANYSLFFK